MCRLCTLSGTTKAVIVDSSTTVSEVIHTFCERITLPYAFAQLFCIDIMIGDENSIGMIKYIRLCLPFVTNLLLFRTNFSNFRIYL